MKRTDVLLFPGLIFLLVHSSCPSSPHGWSSQKWGTVLRIKLFTLTSIKDFLLYVAAAILRCYNEDAEVQAYPLAPQVQKLLQPLDGLNLAPPHRSNFPRHPHLVLHRQ